MTYEESIKEAFSNIINTCSKLSKYESDYVIRNLRTITNHINREEEKNRHLIEKNQGVKKNGYDDALELFSTILYLHGYNDFDIGGEKFIKFVQWFTNHALNNPKYKAERISKYILQLFFDGYKLFELNFDREPSNYGELRDFVFNWEDIINKSIKTEIEKLEKDYGINKS